MKATGWVISYDIKDDRRRNKVYKILKDYGRRVQYSVFEVLLEQAQLEEALERVGEVIVPTEDNVRAYQICSSCRKKIRVIGEGEPFEETDVIIV